MSLGGRWREGSGIGGKLRGKGQSGGQGVKGLPEGQHVFEVAAEATHLGPQLPTSEHRRAASRSLNRGGKIFTPIQIESLRTAVLVFLTFGDCTFGLRVFFVDQSAIV